MDEMGTTRNGPAALPQNVHFCVDLGGPYGQCFGQLPFVSQHGTFANAAQQKVSWRVAQEHQRVEFDGPGGFLW